MLLLKKVAIFWMIHEATKKSTTVSGFFPLESPTGQHEHPHRASLKCLSSCIGSSTCSPVSPKKSLISHHLTNSNHRTVGCPRSLLVSLKKDGSTIRDSRVKQRRKKSMDSPRRRSQSTESKNNALCVLLNQLSQKSDILLLEHE